MKKKRRNRIIRVGLLLLLSAAVFLLTFSRGNYMKKYEDKKETEVLTRICLGWLIEEMPVFQKRMEQPGIFDGFYTWIYPNLAYSFCFEGVLEEGIYDIKKQKDSDTVFWMPEEQEKDALLEQAEWENERENKRKNRILENGMSQVLAETVGNEVNLEQQQNEMAENANVSEALDEVSEENVEKPVMEDLHMGREKQVVYEADQFQDFAELVSHFYVVDPSTSVTEELLDIDRLLEKDFSIDRDSEGPQILIYHTHSQEGFIDSVEGDPSTTIVGAGEYLKELLEEYGYNVIHETGEYDLESRSTAYSNVEPVLERYLEEYPNIQVMIDLHRDEVKEGKLVTEVNGKQTAKFMFFNGLSYLNQVGDISYLYNPNKEDNLAFAFQLQYLSNQYFPGLCRKIYLKGYRYNLHHVKRSLLVELGAQTNTVEEIHNACEPLAEILSRVLSGEK